MTRDELIQEAGEYCANNCGDCYGCHKKYRKNKNCERIKSMIKTYLASAEPREKQLQEKDKKIAELTEQNSHLYNDLTFTSAEVDRLKAQIEKMKCCENCKYKHCDWSSKSIDKDGKITFHNWNETKQDYCDIGNGRGAKYQLWELAND